VLRTLASVGVFTETADGLFGLTPLGATLTSDSPASMRDLAVMWMETHYAAQPQLARHGLGERLQLAGGDFFDAVPAGADLYLLSMVLHDWSDAEASRLLASIRAAAPAGARLVAFELVIPAGDGPHMAKMIDLTMLGMLNGRERTRAEHQLLLERAGFTFEAVTATPTPVSVITARA